MRCVCVCVCVSVCVCVCVCSGGGGGAFAEPQYIIIVADGQHIQLGKGVQAFKRADLVVA